MQILELLVQQLNTNLVHKAITLSVTDDAKRGSWRRRFDRSYGARPLRRALQRFIEDPLSEALIAGGIAERPAFLEVYLENNQLFYRPVAPMAKPASSSFLRVTRTERRGRTWCG
jgi:ATP-dependent Clp protease ATP-binding subunit ClpC